ncbi:MAG: MBL fold metallo-hydrolase [Mangrovibacterium sp.]
MSLAEKISQLQVGTGQIALFYLGQAGFCIKTPDGNVIVIDAYLSDACERLFGFKRMIPAVLGAGELNADLYLSTHSHADHLDPDVLPVVVKNPETFFIGSPDCEELYKQNKLPNSRYKILKEGEEWNHKGIRVRAVFADHGHLAPDAVGFLLSIEGIKIYHTGDTCFAPDKIKTSLNTDVDIMIVPINGQYGNMNAAEACRLSVVVKPEILIASHFWMFLEHVCENGKGDPSTFLRESKDLVDIQARVMAPGELLIYPEKEKSDE